MNDRVTVERGRYHDSVRLMQASRDLLAVPGVTDALVAMATELNLGLLADMSFEVSDDVGPNDLIIAVRASSDEALESIDSVLANALAPKVIASEAGSAPPPKTIGTAARRIDANVALISVPGRYAFVEAMEALESGLHVMIFSDNVPIEYEILLKEEAARRDLLMMGPDCGTAIVGGVGLGFANAVRPGPVGIVGASGTGIQQLCCLLDDAGVGVSQAWGTGSHDLSLEVGGSATIRGLAALDRDPAIEVIAVVSKPPAEAVAANVEAAAAACSTPTVVAFMGPGSTLEAATAEVLAKLGRGAVPHRSWMVEQETPGTGELRGLFSGGTLRDESRFIVEPLLGPVGLREGAPGHTLVDYGDDEYTEGRAHPMIDQTVRLERLQSAIGDPSVSVILLDVVLGYGSHPDPASELAPLIAGLVAAGKAVVASLCGTRSDPQGLDRQAETLHRAGAAVFLSNAAASSHAALLMGGTS